VCGWDNVVIIPMWKSLIRRRQIHITELIYLSSFGADMARVVWVRWLLWEISVIPRPSTVRRSWHRRCLADASTTVVSVYFAVFRLLCEKNTSKQGERLSLIDLPISGRCRTCIYMQNVWTYRVHMCIRVWRLRLCDYDVTNKTSIAEDLTIIKEARTDYWDFTIS